jgi:hypothetical protein
MKRATLDRSTDPLAAGVVAVIALDEARDNWTSPAQVAETARPSRRD